MSDTDLNALAERLERDTRDAVGDLRHAIAIASQAQPDWRSTWEAALAELMPNELDRQAAQALRGMGDWQGMESAPRDGTEVDLLIVHRNALYTLDAWGEGYAAAIPGKWIDHNGGGWTWSGLAGVIMAWRPRSALKGRDELE